MMSAQSISQAKAKKNRTHLERALVGPAGEHYVLYRLHMMGMLASLAPTNAPTVDILVLNEDETIAATIQVKTRTYGSDGGWHMKKKHETLKRPNLFYVFVDLEPETPATFIVPSSVVAEVVREAHKVWLAMPGKKGKEHKDHDMRRVLPAYNFNVPIAPPGWLESYKDAWQLLHTNHPASTGATSKPNGRSKTTKAAG